VTLRAEKMAERRERILASARELIAEGGFEALTTRALARRARVTVPTIYNLVGARDDVLFAAVEEQTARFLASIGGRTSRAPLEQVLAVSDDCVSELLRVPRYYKALLRLMYASESALAARRSVGASVLREFVRGLEAMRAASDLVEGLPVRLLAPQLASQLSSASLQWATGDLDDAGFRRAAREGSQLLLLGATRGAARRQLEDQLQRVGGRRPAPARPEGARPTRRRAR
jgi:AcrR family transcriptional regulator